MTNSKKVGETTTLPAVGRHRGSLLIMKPSVGRPNVALATRLFVPILRTFIENEEKHSHGLRHEQTVARRPATPTSAFGSIAPRN
jgi:hypothetical protein